MNKWAGDATENRNRNLRENEETFYAIGGRVAFTRYSIG